MRRGFIIEVGVLGLFLGDTKYNVNIVVMQVQ
jgi:hypothetical protein